MFPVVLHVVFVGWKHAAFGFKVCVLVVLGENGAAFAFNLGIKVCGVVEGVESGLQNCACDWVELLVLLELEVLGVSTIGGVWGVGG